jgi:ABC-type uncharacterized transport system involved in gliding motility auxiliary subunit
MKIDRKTKLQLRLQSTLSMLLLIAVAALLAWLSTQYRLRIDLSEGQRNSLGEPTLRLLTQLDRPVRIQAFVNPSNALKEVYEDLFARYRQAQPLIEYRIHNPDLVPEKLEEYGVLRDGEVVIELDQRRENLPRVTESTLTNAIARLMRQGERFIAFLEGHGERAPFGQRNADYNLFAGQLEQKGFSIEMVNLVKSPEVPANTTALVIADAATDLLPGEIQAIARWLDRGGNLLWLSEPDSRNNLDAIAEYLDIEFLPGVVIDPNSQVLGLNRVDFALVADYGRHPITNAVNAVSLYPRARALRYAGDENAWKATPLLLTGAQSWNETGPLEGDITAGDNDGEQSGPLTLGWALTRSIQHPDGALKTQRIVVVGDADFLASQFLGNGANAALGLDMINWLSHDDALIAIDPKSAPDTELDLSRNAQIFIFAMFMLVLPLGLVVTGILVWRRRRSR